MSLTPGSVVLVFGGHHPEAGSNYGPTTGYTQVRRDSIYSTAIGLWYKRMGTTPDTNVVCYGDANSNHPTAYLAIGLTGAHATDPIDAGPNYRYASEVPNCVTITTITDSAWVIAAAASTIFDATPGTISGYTNDVTTTQDDGYDLSVALATKLVPVAGAEDPGAWSDWGTGAVTSYTFAVKAAPAASKQITSPIFKGGD
jgi:hypothetical protein